MYKRKIFRLSNNTTTRTMFVKIQYRGLGIRKPSIIYRATRINHLIKMLNHPNDNFRFIACNSFILDFKKRGTPRSETDENYLGYAVKDNRTLETHIKGGFDVQSDWPHRFNLVKTINTNLKWEKNTKDLHHAGKAQLMMILKHNETSIPQNNRIRMQGRLIDKRYADYLMLLQ